MDDSPLALLPALPFAWIDQLGLILASVFLLLGMWRGLWWQVIRLAGVVLAVALARTLSPRFTPTIQEQFTELSPSVAHGIVWLVLFLGGLVLGSLFGMVGKRAIDAMHLAPMDRLGGALAGAATGLGLHSAFLVVLCGLGSSEWSERTIAGTRSALLLNAISNKANLFLDAEAAERLLPGWVGGPAEPNGVEDELFPPPAAPR